MRLILIFLSATLTAQSLHFQNSHTSESLRGVSTVSRQIAWASGTHGTYLRTIDGGKTWDAAQVPNAGNLDFRAVIAFSADEAFLLSAGPADQSRIFHTIDGGAHWQLQFTNTNPKGFFDSMVFWDPKHGIVLGDPIPDENGKLKFEILLTDDGGESWHAMLSAQLPEALPGEGAFAASNSCIAILPGRPWKSGASAPRQPGENGGALAPDNLDPNIWFATGGAAARVFHSADRGQTWQVVDTPVLHGPESAGIFSIAFRNDRDGVVAGGDYKRPTFDGPNLAFTHDGGKTWAIAEVHPQAYFSAVAYDPKITGQARAQWQVQGKAELKRNPITSKPDSRQRLFIVNPDFVYDFRPPRQPHRLAVKAKPAATFNAVSPFPEGGALLVGAKGTIAVVP